MAPREHRLNDTAVIEQAGVAPRELKLVHRNRLAAELHAAGGKREEVGLRADGHAETRPVPRRDRQCVAGAEGEQQHPKCGRDRLATFDHESVPRLARVGTRDGLMVGDAVAAGAGGLGGCAVAAQHAHE